MYCLTRKVELLILTLINKYFVEKMPLIWNILIIIYLKKIINLLLVRVEEYEYMKREYYITSEKK